MVMDDLDLVLDLKDKEEWVRPILIMIFMTMMKRITLLDIKEDLFIENLVVDLKDVNQVDLAVDLKDVDEDKRDLVADLKENKAIFEMTSTLQAIKIIQFWKMYEEKDKLLDVLMMKVAVPLQIVYLLNFVEETIANTTLVKTI